MFKVYNEELLFLVTTHNLHLEMFGVSKTNSDMSQNIIFL